MFPNQPLILLAGGFGKRLKSVTGDLPKPLVDINSTPFIIVLIKHMITYGFQEFILLLHYKAELIRSYIESSKDKSIQNCLFHYVIENRPLGTGGAIAHAVAQLKLKKDILIMNSDTWIEKDLDKVYNSSKNVISLIKNYSISRYGRVHINKDNLICEFEEKGQEVDDRNSAYLINAGFYKLDAGLFYDWNKEAFSLENEMFPKLVNEQKLYGAILDSKFIDIGVPEDYYEFCQQNLK